MTFKIKSILAILASVAVIGAANAQMEIKLGHLESPDPYSLNQAKSLQGSRMQNWPEKRKWLCSDPANWVTTRL